VRKIVYRHMDGGALAPWERLRLWWCRRQRHGYLARFWPAVPYGTTRECRDCHLSLWMHYA
jgi:hypothetical protein